MQMFSEIGHYFSQKQKSFAGPVGSMAPVSRSKVVHPSPIGWRGIRVNLTCPGGAQAHENGRGYFRDNSHALRAPKPMKMGALLPLPQGEGWGEGYFRVNDSPLGARGLPLAEGGRDGRAPALKDNQEGGEKGNSRDTMNFPAKQ